MGYLPSLSLSRLVFKMGTIRTLQACCEDSVLNVTNAVPSPQRMLDTHSDYHCLAPESGKELWIRSELGLTTSGQIPFPKLIPQEWCCILQMP